MSSPYFCADNEVRWMDRQGRAEDHAVLATSRLLLVKTDHSGRRFFSEYLVDPIHTLYLPRNRPYTLEESALYHRMRLKHWRENGFGTWLIKLRGWDSGDSVERIIGFCGLEFVAGTEHVDLRYGIDRRYQGRAFALEAALAVVGVGFESLALGEIYGAAEHDNIASLRVLEKIGMARCGDVDFYGSMVKYFRIDQQEWAGISQVGS